MAEFSEGMRLLAFYDPLYDLLMLLMN